MTTPIMTPLITYLTSKYKDELLRPLPKKNMERHGLTDRKYLELTRKR